MADNASLALVKKRLKQRGCKRSGDDWTCPSHEDRKPSLTVKAGDRTPVILACGQCEPEQVLAALGLSWDQVLGLAPDDSPKVVRKQAEYLYSDKRGEVAYRVVRLLMSDGSKTFRQHKAKPGGGWENSLGDAKRVLYNLPGLRQAITAGDTIHLTEGEKDADALNAYFEERGLAEFATCHSGGGGKWDVKGASKRYLKSLRGASRVVVWADRDGLGYSDALERFTSVVGAGLPAEIRLPIPTAPKADVFDHLEAGHKPKDGQVVTEAALRDLVGTVKSEAEHKAVAAELDRIRIRERAKQLHAAEVAASRAVTLERVTLDRALAAPRPEEPPMLVDRLHAVGYNSTITAQFKTGKTTLIGNLVRALVDGPLFLDEFAVTRPEGRVGLLNYELTDADMLDWLDAQSIQNAERVALLNLRGVPFSLATEVHQERLAQWCRDMDVDVLILDPHRRAFAGFGSENSNDDVNRFTGVLDEIKAAGDVSDLFLSVHTGRFGGEEGSEHARGATAIDDWADQRWVLTKDPESDNDRFLSVSGRLRDVGEFRLSYDPESRRLLHEGGSRKAARIDRFRRPILAALDAAGEEVNTGDLERRLEIRKAGALKATLDTLLFEGLVSLRKEGRSKFWSLPVENGGE